MMVASSEHSKQPMYESKVILIDEHDLPLEQVQNNVNPSECSVQFCDNISVMECEIQLQFSTQHKQIYQD